MLRLLVGELHPTVRLVVRVLATMTTGGLLLGLGIQNARRRRGTRRVAVAVIGPSKVLLRQCLRDNIIDLKSGDVLRSEKSGNHRTIRLRDLGKHK